MASRSESPWLDPAVARYCAERARPRPDAVAADLIERTSALGDLAGMQIGPDQGVLLGILVRLARARLAVEVGTFTGYSALAIARALPEDGRLIACDVSAEWTAVGREHWRRAAVDHKIDLRLGPALTTLRALPAEPVVDLAFIDADKPSYADYYDELVPRLRPGGLLIADNTLWSGRVVDPAADDRDTVALQRFNDVVAADDRVDTVVLPIADGITLALKR